MSMGYKHHLEVQSSTPSYKHSCDVHLLVDFVINDGSYVTASYLAPFRGPGCELMA